MDDTELVGPLADYLRATELLQATSYGRLARRPSNPVLMCSTGPWANAAVAAREPSSSIRLFPISASMSYNSKYPTDRNNGVMWGGRGLSALAAGGAVVGFRSLSVGILPALTYQQNKAYDLVPVTRKDRSTFASGMYSTIDLPQRFGDGASTVVDAGQSYARIDIWKLGAGISNENVWWGPGISNAILFTNTAPGFAHAFASIREPIDVRIGKISGELFWGRLRESEFFDTLAANDNRFVAAALISFEPDAVKGLHVGFGRTFVTPWDSAGISTALSVIQPFWKKDLTSEANPQGNSNDDQRLSIMARWLFPNSGFELYGEWAREDHAWDWQDFVQEPEHSSGHVVGFQKLFVKNDSRWVRAYAEAANLQTLRQHRPGLRTTATFYDHGPQGHTQRGQLLGASIGPGGESQLAGIDVIHTTGLFGFYFERVRRDEFSTRAIQAWSTAWPPRHDVEITGGVRITRRISDFRVDADLAHSKRYNRNFIRDENNTRAQVRMTWVPNARVATKIGAAEAEPNGRKN